MNQAALSAGCDGKERFKTYELAGRVKERQRKRRDSQRLQVYRCRSCNGFHIGNAEFRPVETGSKF